MKLTKNRNWLVILVLLMVFTLFVSACSPKGNDAKPSVDPPEPDDSPIYGGTIRMISTTGPNVLGLPGAMSPGDDLLAQPALEPLIEFVDKEDRSGGTWGGVLARDWKTDPQNNSLTFYLQEGVRFHDGTPFNAEAVLWNFTRQFNKKTLPGVALVDRFEVLDEFTFRIYATKIDPLLYQTWGRERMISPTAFEAAGNGDLAKSEEWAKQNIVSTGPFKQAKFERGSKVSYVRNDDYWREGYPYLDALEIIIVEDPSTAAAMLEAGQADYWLASPPLEHSRLVDMGFQDWRSDWGMVYVVMTDSADPTSPFADKRVREALEYAIDREKVALMVGHGTAVGLTQLAPPYEIGYDPNWNPRPYNPEKAKQLLADAGYPNGFETTMVTQSVSMSRDMATAIQGYLDAIGIKVQVDLADPARYAAAVFTEGFKGMALTAHGADSTGRSINTHFGVTPRTFRTGVTKKSDVYMELASKMLTNFDQNEYAKATAATYKQAVEDAMVAPIISTLWLHTAAPYVRSENRASFVWHSFYDYWLVER